MEELVQKLMAQANLGEDQAKKVVNVVADFLGDKLPPAIGAQVRTALTSDAAVDQVTRLADEGAERLGGLFGSKK